MAEKILITGIDGFVGRYLAEYILESQKNAVIFGGDQKKLKTPRSICELSEFRGKQISNFKTAIQNSKLIKFFKLDIRSKTEVMNLIGKIRPDIVFHLAARISVPESWEEPREYFETNVTGTLNLLEAVRQYCPRATILIPGSSEEYGKSNLKSPTVRARQISNLKSTRQDSRQKIDEDWPVEPQSPYALTKMCQEMLGRQYFEKYGLKVISVRTFNITGPGQSGFPVCSSFARQIAMIEAGKQKPIINVGNLNIIRDFIDARDVAKAYFLAIKKCKPGEVYNICSGTGYQIKDILNELLSYTAKKIVIKKDQNLFRKSEPLVIIGDNKKFSGLTGWHPEINILRETSPDLLSYWRTYGK